MATYWRKNNRRYGLFPWRRAPSALDAPAHIVVCISYIRMVPFLSKQKATYTVFAI
jgi:hypothetical protein